MKKTWIFTALAVVLTLAVLFGVSRVVLYTDETGFHVVDRNAAEIYVNKDAWKFENIELETVDSNIEFVITNRFGFEFMADSTMDTVYTNQDGKLSIRQSSKDLLLNFNLWPTKKDYVKLYIPDRVDLKQVKINAKNGEITIARLKCENLDITSDTGNITVTLAGQAEDYNSDITADGGSITVDGKAVEAYQVKNADATKSVTINANGGDVTVYFKGQ
ncbi:MAG TPA: DUF4097 family beta strand repeat-containing protein [Clostridia bacterium]|nr:DUF4097 family beta strand repeat-containing protein [Clostridia bacterium]